MTTSDTPITVDVLIIGAGPTGLILAIELLRRGVSCRVVDMNDGPAPHSRAVAVQARTLELCAAIGVVEEMLAKGVRTKAFSLHADGKLRAHVALTGIESPYPFVLSLPQTETERILLTKFMALGGQVERQIKLTALMQDAKGVTAELTHSDDTIETAHVSYLVGCDGAHSATRHLLHASFDGSPYADTFWLADVHLDWQQPHGELSAFLSDGAFLFAIPLDTGGRYRLIAQQHGADPAHEPTLAEFQALVNTLGPTGTQLSDPIWLTTFHLHHRKVARYRDRRVFLAGDAAHIHSPAGGQGMNTGIQDAHNLAWKLAFALHNGAGDALLETYHTERDAVGTRVLRGSDTVFRLVRTRNPLLRRLRDLAFTLVLPRAAIQRRGARSVSEVNIRYAPGIAVTRDPGGTGVRVGIRAPDVTLHAITNDKPVRFFTILAASPNCNTYTLLLLPGTAPSPTGSAALMGLAADIAKAYDSVVAPVLIESEASMMTPWQGTGACYRDAANAMHTRYGAKSATAYLVRPDGYIAWHGMATDGDVLHAHLRGIFGPPPTATPTQREPRA